MNKLYNEYISVDSDFIPVFSEHSDKINPGKWKSFYPHDSFKTIISQLMDTLEKGSISKDQPMWMYGAYGTGKTYASFVIKHVLEDDLSDIEAYCQTNEMMPLYSRISGVRNKGDILVVHRSSAAGVVGDNKLFNCIVESIKASLKKNNYSYMGGKSQYDIILSTLKDPTASFNFQNVFEKYKRKFEGYANAASVIRDLEELGPEDTTDLLETIVEVAELERYFWSTSHTDVIAWIDDVIKGNNLYLIVFIWDEFTEYFKKNQNSISGLQELAQAAASISFYLFLITHSGAQIINDQNAKKVIEARFKIKPIDMAETTAFILMGKAIKHDLDLRSEWDKISSALWGKVELSTKNTVIKYAKDITASELYALLPIHPYAAYLLKVISTEISSNQRTMFQFLSGDYLEGDKIRKNFRWFIDNHNDEMGSWNYLTADYIWDYFFTDDNVDLSDAFKSAIAQYDNYAPFYKDNEDKLKVLKVALLLSATQQKAGAGRAQGQSALLRATASNIHTAFEGTPISAYVSITMAEFVSRSIFSTIQDGNDTLYIPPVGNIDQERFDKMLEENRRIISFEKILADNLNAVNEQFLPEGFMKYRYETYLTSTLSDSYKSAVKDAKVLDVNIIPLFYVYSLNETEQSKSSSIIEKILEDVGRNAVVVDFSETPFTDSAYEKYIYSKTEERYYKEDTNQAKLARQNATQIVRDWKIKLNVTNLNIYPKTDGQITKVQGGGNLRKKLKEFNSIWFGSGLEEISINDKLFAPTGYKEIVAQMSMGHMSIPNNYSYLNQIPTKLANENIWSNPNYATDSPGHVVSQMKKAMTDTIENGFNNVNSMVAITDIWDVLKRPPFGLLSCTGSVFLLGFLLKEYADSTYYKYDGANTVALNHTDLSDLIFAAVKEQSKAKGQYIVKQKPEHAEFCRISGMVFKIAKDKQNSVQDIAKNISVFLKNNEHPLWSLEYFADNELDDDTNEVLITAIRLYCELISTDKAPGRGATKIAEELYALYKRNAGLDTYLEKIVRVENMKKGMVYYIATYKPELIPVIKRLGLNEQMLPVELNKTLSDDATYLWDIGDTNHQIDNIYESYLLIDAINGVLTDKQSSYNDACAAVEKRLNIIKLPKTLITEELPHLAGILNCLVSIRNRNILNKLDVINQISQDKDAFNVFFENQIQTFSDVAFKRIGNISQDEIMYLSDKVPHKAFFSSPDEFIPSMNAMLIEYRKDKKINQLYELWNKIANSESPAEWSKTHNISILCLFEDVYDKASDVFDLINNTRLARTAKEAEQAIEFLNSIHVNIIKDLQKCNSLFVSYFAGEYSYLIDDPNELKVEMRRELGDNVYGWINNKKAYGDCVNKLIQQKYQAKYLPKIVEKIQNLAPTDAQKLLLDLAEGTPLIGAKILKL